MNKILIYCCVVSVCIASDAGNRYSACVVTYRSEEEILRRQQKFVAENPELRNMVNRAMSEERDAAINRAEAERDALDEDFRNVVIDNARLEDRIRGFIDAEQNNPNSILTTTRDVLDMLDRRLEDVCTICIGDIGSNSSEPNMLSVARCSHIFCDNCLAEAIRHRKACPTCRAEL